MDPVERLTPQQIRDKLLYVGYHDLPELAAVVEDMLDWADAIDAEVGGAAVFGVGHFIAEEIRRRVSKAMERKETFPEMSI